MVEKENPSQRRDLITALGTSDRPNAFKGIVNAFDGLYAKGTPPAEIAENAEYVFDRIADEVPQGHVPIYLLARTYPDLTPKAVPAMRKSAGSPEELSDVSVKVKKLREIDSERKNPVEYEPFVDEILTVSPDVTRTFYNAIKYNEQGKRLMVLPMTDLPEIPGQVAVSIEQEGRGWGIELHLKSKEVDTSEAQKESAELTEYLGLTFSSKGESFALQRLAEDIKTVSVLQCVLGKIRFSKYPGWKQLQEKVVHESLATLEEAIPNILGDEFSAEEYTNTKMVVQGDAGEKYHVGMNIYEQTGHSESIDGLLTTRMGGSSMPGLTDDYEQFQKDLQRELRFASGIISWLYQHARTDVNYKINLHSPDFGLLDWMEGNNLIEKLRSSPNSFTDLGGNHELRLDLEDDTAQFIRSFNGDRGALKPQNTILFGETGIGKTSLENGIASQLLEADVPVFVLKGDLFAQTMLENPEEGVKHLKQMFYYLLMHGGAVMVRDFDALLGSRDKPEANTLIEGVLLSELEKIKKDPSTWFVADTQFIGRISEALLNAHRIGKQREVPLEKDPQGIEHIIIASVRKIDKEIQRRAEPLYFAQIQTEYPFDIASLAQKIADTDGMIPAQIERLIREEMQSHSKEGYLLETESLITRVDAYAEERAKMEEIRKKQKEEQQQAMATEALRVAKEALAEVTRLREGLIKEVTEMRTELTQLTEDVALGSKKDETVLPRIGKLETKLNLVAKRVFPESEAAEQE